MNLHTMHLMKIAARRNYYTWEIQIPFSPPLQRGTEGYFLKLKTQIIMSFRGSEGTEESKSCVRKTS